MIKNVILDLGVILVGLDSGRCIKAFQELGAGEVARYVEHHLTADLFYDIEVGRITTEQFCEEVRRLMASSEAKKGEGSASPKRPIPSYPLLSPPENAAIVAAWNSLLTEIPSEKLSWLEKNSGKYNLYLLSNTNDMHWQCCNQMPVATHGRTLSSYFRHCFLSYEMHLAKPSAEIFEEVLRQASLTAAETLFIDDNAANCAAAEKTGIQTLCDPTGRTWINSLTTPR